MKFTIFKRLTFGYVAIMVLVVFLGGFVTTKLNQLNRLTQAIAAVDSTTIRGVENLLEVLLSQVGFERKYLVAKDPDFSQQFWAKKEDFLKDAQKLAPLMDGPEKKKLLAEITRSYHNYLSLFEKEINLIKESRKYSSRKYYEEKERMIDEINQKLGQIIRITRRQRDRRIETSNQISVQVLKVTSVTALLIIMTGLLISFFNTRSIHRSIWLLKKKTREIAKGNFENIPPIAGPPEIGELADDFNFMCRRLKELDQLKVDFISHVSHELRTPLTAIREASSMLLAGTYANVPEKQHELLIITKQECERLIASVTRILDLSRMESKMMEYHFSHCNLLPVIQKTVLKLAAIAQSKKISLELKPPSALPWLNIDPEKIGIVMENLIGNALKFTPSGGFVVINAALANNRREFVEISVTDSGTGIPQASLEKIFDKFRRIDDGIQTPRGTGLGLSIAKHVVAAHGGKIWAESQPGRGSTFFFTLPVS
ncbi:MAG: MCP four helix bundle domain-containing protein [Desulfobacterales bacterium]|nr:MAG: MCP four helix bundle domain-containing protein [Desulfobacterales bacterium]